MTDKPEGMEEKPHSNETKLTIGMLANRLNDYQTIFIERMQNFQEYIEGIENRHAVEIQSQRDRIAALEAVNEKLNNALGRLSNVERTIAPILATASLRQRG